MSRNWRMPASRARYVTVRLRYARFSRTADRIDGNAAAILSPESRSAAKLSFPSSQ
jgi:hypothetical protein